MVWAWNWVFDCRMASASAAAVALVRLGDDAAQGVVGASFGDGLGGLSCGEDLEGQAQVEQLADVFEGELADDRAAVG